MLLAILSWTCAPSRTYKTNNKTNNKNIWLTTVCIDEHTHIHALSMLASAIINIACNWVCYSAFVVLCILYSVQLKAWTIAGSIAPSKHSSLTTHLLYLSGVEIMTSLFTVAVSISVITLWIWKFLKSLYFQRFINTSPYWSQNILL